MSTIILIPAILSTLALFFWTPARVFRDVVLPSLLLLPLYYFWKVALLPPIDFADTAMLPLGIGMCLFSTRRWRFSIMDLWLILFVISSGAGDRLLGQNTPSVFELFDSVCRVLIPYMAGKLLIEEDGARAETIRRIVTLMAGALLIGAYECFGRNNPYRMVFKVFFPPSEPLDNVTQIRRGLGRVCGPYMQAELAGMMLIIGFMLLLYLSRYYEWGDRFHRFRAFPIRKAALVGGTLFVGLLLTQSRGPELGLLFAAPIGLIGRSRRVLRTALIVSVLMVVGGAVAYEGVMGYAATHAPSSEEQQTAAYRAKLLENYLPMAEHSGAWGLGPRFPRLGEANSLYGVQDSIDNEYLLLALTQGWVGLGTFLLLIGGTVYNLVAAAIANPEKRDRAFAFTLLGIFVGIVLTITTVYLGAQPQIFFFLLIGWSQAVRVRRAPQPHPVFAQVFT